MGGTFVPHGGDVVEPLLHRGDAVWRVLVATARDLGDGRHGTLQGATWLRYHGVVSKMEVQRLHDVGGVVSGACSQTGSESSQAGSG